MVMSKDYELDLENGLMKKLEQQQIISYEYDDYHSCILLGCYQGSIIRLFYSVEDSVIAETSIEILEEEAPTIPPQTTTAIKLMWCLEVANFF